jgi:FkbM family methyltransferase
MPSVLNKSTSAIRALVSSLRVPLAVAMTVSQSTRFLLREMLTLPSRAMAIGRARLAGSGRAAQAPTTKLWPTVAYRYQSRETSEPFFLRNGSPDTFVAYQTLARKDYEPPAPVIKALSAVIGPLNVVDLGANIGLFAVYAAGRYPGCRITCFEPDPDNLEVLWRTYSARHEGPAWEIVEACAGTEDGVVPFLTSRFAASRAASSSDSSAAVAKVPVRDVFPFLQEVDLLKMDIEGGEWAILSDPRLAGIPARAVVLEFHPWMAPPGNPSESAAAYLRGAGFEICGSEPAGDGMGVMWAARA